MASPLLDGRGVWWASSLVRENVIKQRLTLTYAKLQLWQGPMRHEVWAQGSWPSQGENGEILRGSHAHMWRRGKRSKVQARPQGGRNTESVRTWRKVSTESKGGRGHCQMKCERERVGSNHTGTHRQCKEMSLPVLTAAAVYWKLTMYQAHSEGNFYLWKVPKKGKR